MVRGSKVQVRVPQRGEKRALLTTVGRNAQEAFTRHKLKRASDHNARAKALTALQEALELPEAPLRIECFDISNLQGTEIVASMVVMEDGIAKVASQRHAVLWVRDMVSRPDVIQLYTHAAVFCCPSVYEPFGIINLEAMACETAVVASAVGGIPEVVVPGETGFLVDPHLRPGTFEPADPAAFSAGLAREGCRRFGRARAGSSGRCSTSPARNSGSFCAPKGKRSATMRRTPTCGSRATACVTR